MDLTVREAAQRIGRAEETIRRWIWSGRLPARKVGNAYRLAEADLDAASRSIPVPREAADRRAASPDLREWLERLLEWQAGNAVDKRPGAWRLVVEDRIERSERAGRHAGR